MDEAPSPDRKKQRRDERPDGGGGPPPLAAVGLPSAPQLSRAPSSKAGDLVLVWDLDETLLIFNSLSTGTWALSHPGADAEGLRRLAATWQQAILRGADKYMLFHQVEEYDVSCVGDVAPFDDHASLAGHDFLGDGFPGIHPAAPATAAAPGGAGAGGSGEQQEQPEQRSEQQTPAPQQQEQLEQQQELEQQQQGRGQGQQPPAGQSPKPPKGGGTLDLLPVSALGARDRRLLAYRWRYLSSVYACGLAALGTPEVRASWAQAFEATDRETGGWISHAARLLAACSATLGDAGRTVHHVAVSSGQLVPSLAKLLLFRLDAFFPGDRVYSSRGASKDTCFAKLEARFSGCSFVAIGDGVEEEQAASQRNWPYIRVLLADIGAYPASYVARLAPDATGSLGRPLPDLTVEHVRAAAALGIAAAAGPSS